MAQSQNTLDSRDAGGNNSNGKDMTSTLLRGQVLDDLAQHLYDFLPGQPHPYADASISFSGVARDLGLGSAWQGGSKRPALRKMLEFVIDRNGNQFTRLLVMIVERSMTYRRSKIPLCREEIEELNSLVTRLGFKAPELHDPAFLDRLPRKHPVKTGQQEGATTISDEALTALREKLTALNGMAPQKRGYAFESFLNELFDLFSLAPRGSFRLVGEQIDGSFQLGQDVYLVEAKWQNEKKPAKLICSAFPARSRAKRIGHAACLSAIRGSAKTVLKPSHEARRHASSAWKALTSITCFKASLT
jgi:hypothetical protein